MDNQTIHEPAVVYASSKLTEYELDKRNAPLCGYTSMSSEEVQYLKSSYIFAIHHLSE